MIKLSEACGNIDAEIRIVRDCGFDELYLVGKPYPEGRSVITYLGASKYIAGFMEYDIAGVICTEEIAEELAGTYSGGIAIAEDPKTAFFRIHNYYAERRVPEKNRIAETAVIHPTAYIEDSDVIIGERTVVMANAIIKSGSRIGDDCVICETCVIGAPAFYYFGAGSGKKAVISTGTVEMGNNVEINSNSVVEKGVMGGGTRIGDNTKIDNLCLIGHDSQIGENVIIAGKTVLAGGVELREGSFLGVGVTISPYVTCGEHSIISSGSVVTKDVPENAHVSGNFAIPHDKFIKNLKEISK